MEFKVIKRNGNAIVPDGMFKLCGMEDAKLISMVQLNGGILLMPESVSTYQLLMLIDALNEQACEFLEAVAAECGRSRFLQSEYRSARTGCDQRPAGIAGSSAAHPSDHACTMPDRRQSRQHPRWPRNPVWCLP